MSTAFETTDLDVAMEVLSEGYGAVRLRSNDQHTSFSITQHDVNDAVRLDRIHCEMDFEAIVPPMGFILVGRVVEGATTYHHSGEDDHYGPGEVFLCAQPDEPDIATVGGLVTMEVAAMQPRLFAEIAQNAPGAGPAVRLLDYEPISASAADRWWQTYDFVRAIVNHPASQTAGGLYAGQAARLLAAVALSTFPNTSLTDPDATDRHDAHPASLRRAISFIEANPDRDITPAEIAEAAGVSIRALQLTFRRHLATTPLTYLRHVRLAAAREGLVAADPDRTTIATVAARWGFYNFGRFAGDYRTQFGELPSQTLSR